LIKILKLCIVISIHRINSYKLKYLNTACNRKTAIPRDRITGLNAFIEKGRLNPKFPKEVNELDLPEFIQSSNKLTVEVVKGILSIIYANRNYARFAALETIARVPYFSYTSVLHLYETLGWFRKKEYIQIHFAESWNELHHLLIMESLGGNQLFFDRFVAQHIAFFYYWLVVILYMVSPAVAYDLNKHVEQHAYATYDEFLTSHADELRAQPAPQVAIDYYQKGDLYMFDAFQYDLAAVGSKAVPLITTEIEPQGVDGVEDDNASQSHKSLRRRPIVKTLYDVFYNIREDEAEHASTMQILQRDITLRNRGRD